MNNERIYHPHRIWLAELCMVAAICFAIAAILVWSLIDAVPLPPCSSVVIGGQHE